MHVALTGVSGFIGSAIAKRLHQAGHTVAGLVRASSRRDHIEPFVERFITGEQDDESCWPALLGDADCVIHNSVDWTVLQGKDFNRHLQSNLVGTLKLLAASAPRQFVYVSSIAVHHDMRPRWNGVIDEDHPLRPAGWYGAFKAAVEPHLWADHFMNQRNTCAHRPCAVYGIDPKLDRSYGFSTITKLKAGEIANRPGGGKFVHVDDVAAAIVASVGNPQSAGRAYNLVDCYARWNDWGVIAAELLGIKAQFDLASPPQARNTFTKDAAASLGVKLDRGHEGIRAHLSELIALM